MTRHDPFAAAPPDLRELLALASDLALQAGRIHATGRQEALRIETKSSPTDLVSQVDKAAEQLIVERLSSERPDDAILGEEGASRDGTSGLRWVVDPLDGTTNYVYGYPAYSVSIAVEIGGEAQVGVVLDSSSGRLYRAVAGSGAVCDDRPIRARVPEGLATALVATGFSYGSAQRELEGAVLAALLGRIRDIRRSGTAALDLCRLAAGEVRPPLLDHRVVAFARRLPRGMRIHGGETKWLLRRVLDRYVPRELVSRPKMGFGIPLASWLRAGVFDLARVERFRAESFEVADGHASERFVDRIVLPALR